MQKNINNNYDVIVIGSGLSGITTAGLLSKVYKKKVLVLEKHYEPGGLTHEFKRGPYSWDVGVHYVTDMSKRLLDHLGLFLLRFLTNGRLKFNKMQNPFDIFVFPGFSLAINATVKEYKKTMIKQFPHEKKAIKKYVHDVHMIRLWYLCDFFSKFLHPPLAQLFRLLRRFNSKKALMTTYDYLNKHFDDDKLKAALVTRWGNYGIPPKESAFAIHAILEHHYYSGCSFPEGGAEKIFSYIEETIEASGGHILINRDVTKIILENNKAIGVCAKNLANPEKNIEEFYAPIIISSAGAYNTYLKMLPESLNLPIQEKLRNFSSGYSAINIYLGLKDSPEKLGIKGENYWIINSSESDFLNTDLKNVFDDGPVYSFVSFPSMKSGKKNAHTAEIVAIYSIDAFKKWENEYWKEHSNDYYKLKDELMEKYLNVAESKIPGFKDMVIYKEMATPLTFKHFTNRKNGAFYGLPATPERYKLTELKVKTSIKGLYLTGTDILSDGVMASLFTGFATASYLGGPLGIFKMVSRALFFRPSSKLSDKKTSEIFPYKSHTEDKTKAQLVEKKQVNINTIELTFKFEETLRFIPGQHVKLLVSESEWRAYSIAKSDKHYLTLIIDTRPKGHGSNYAKNIKINNYTIFRLPLTDLIYHESDNDIMFIATGTGFVPFIHILDELKKKNKKLNVVILFGCLKDEDNFIDEYVKPYEKYFSIKKHICIDEPNAGSPHFKGRVTDFINQSDYNFKDYDFYICGHPNMTDAASRLLRNKGVNKIYW